MAPAAGLIYDRTVDVLKMKACRVKLTSKQENHIQIILKHPNPNHENHYSIIRDQHPLVS